MGGKKATSTSKVSIPPEVLARYNAVNARAETAANTPFQGIWQYSVRLCRANECPAERWY